MDTNREQQSQVRRPGSDETPDLSVRDSRRELRSEGIVFKRVLSAPAEDVWQAWTDCERLQQWWGSQGRTTSSCEIDLSEGGKYLFGMRVQEGHGEPDVFTAGTYHRIEPVRHLTFREHMADEQGEFVDPRELDPPGIVPPEREIHVDLEPSTSCSVHPEGGCTELTVTAYGYSGGRGANEFMREMNESLDRLAESLNTGQECRYWDDESQRSRAA